jgi:hypothetical protein
MVMDNKLSELSKPVAWKIHNDDHCFLEIREEEAAAYGRMGKKFDPIYSQEYVSGLQAELERKNKYWNSAEDELERAKQRIAELESKLATPVQASGWISWHGGMFRPVRSDTIIDVMFANGNVKPNICAGSVVFEWQKTPKDNQRITAYRLHRRGAANWEAQPVAWTTVFGDKRAVTVHQETAEIWVNDGKKAQPLYTAPAAPAVPDERAAFNTWNNEDNLPIAGIPAKNAAWLAWQARAMLATAPDAVDVFADQVIGTKTKIIRMPAPLNVPQEDIRVYLNADELFMHLEKQGYIVEVSNE